MYLECLPSIWTNYARLSRHSELGWLGVLTIVIDETSVNRAVLLLGRGKDNICNVSSFPIYRTEAPYLVC